MAELFNFCFVAQRRTRLLNATFIAAKAAALSRLSAAMTWGRRHPRSARSGVAVVAVLAMLLSSAVALTFASAPAARATTVPGAGQLVTLSAPARVVNTTGGATVTDSYTGRTQVGALSPGSYFNYDFLGHGGVPSSNVEAVLLHVLTTDGTTSPAGVGNGYLYVYQNTSGSVAPNSTNDPHPVAETVANSGEGLDADNTIIVPVDANGQVSFYDSTATGNVAVDVVADVQGYVTSSTTASAGATYASVSPTRVLDTRTGTGGVPVAQIFPGSPLTFHILGTGGVPNNGTVAAVAFNLGAANPDADKYLAATTNDPTPSNPIPAGAAETHVWTGGTGDQLAVVQPDASGDIYLSTNDSSGMDAFIDVEGYYLTAAAGGTGDVYVPVTPTTIVNTEASPQVGITTGTGPGGQLGAGQTFSGSHAIQITGVGGVPSTGVDAVALSLDARNPKIVSGQNGVGYIQAWPDGVSQPAAYSTVNVDASSTQTVDESDLDFAKPGTDGAIDLYNSAQETTDLDVAIEGYFSSSLAAQAVSPKVASNTGTLQAKVTSAYGGQLGSSFSITDTTHSATATGTGTTVSAGQVSSWTPSGGFYTDGDTYTWSVYATTGGIAQGKPATGTFVYDVTAPTAPSVTANHYTSNTWASGNTSSTFTFSASDSGSGVDHYLYGLDNPSPETSTGVGQSTTPSLSIPGGWHTMYVRAVDAAGNLSSVSQFNFGAGPGVVSPTDGATTEHSLTLTATTTPGVTQVNFFYRLQSSTANWALIPTGDVAPVSGAPAFSGWPYTFTAWSSNGTATPGLVWNVNNTLSQTSGPVQIAACFGSATTCALLSGSLPSAASPSVGATFDHNGFYADTEPVGPGTVNLITGNYNLDTADVSVPGNDGTDLTLERSLNAFTAASTTGGITGPGWSVTLPVDSADNDYAGLSDIGSVLNLTNSDGSTISFAKSSSGPDLPTGQYSDSGLSIAVPSSCTTSYACYQLTDLDGDTTVFQSVNKTPLATGTPALPIPYLMISAAQPGSGVNTTYTLNKFNQYMSVLAPVPVGATCTNVLVAADWTPGCRGLYLTYNGANLLTTVTYQVNNGTGPIQVDVACYTYSSGLLSQEWDPRDIQTPNGNSSYPITCDTSNPVRPTTYTYYLNGQVKSIAAAGLDTESFIYSGSATNPATNASIISATDSAGSSSLTTAVIYGVPVADSADDGNRPDLSSTTAGTWGQVDDPDSTINGTAICPPEASQPTSPTGNLQTCQLSYPDSNGLVVNTASYSGSGESGWQVTTTEYNALGNTIRSLTADNRDEALNPTTGAGATLGLPSDTATAAMDLSTVDLYTPNQVDSQPDLTSVYGPYHQFELANGTITFGRRLTADTYDTGSETGHPMSGGLPLPEHLMTTTVESASISTAAVPTSLTNSRETEYNYTNGSDTSGWTFGTPLLTITDPSGLDLVSTQSLDPSTGDVTSISQPSDTTGSGVGTEVTEYYTTAATTNRANNGDPDCENNPQWAGQVCKTQPASQPTTTGLPGLITTFYSSYDYLDRPTVEKDIVTDANNNVQTRTTTTAYGFNSSGNPFSNDTYSTATTGGVGIAVPTITNNYSTTTGLQTGAASAATSQNAASATATGYDGFGRVTSYTDNTDATGNQANQTSTTYDPTSGLVSQTSDAHGTVAYTYDQNGENRQLPTKEAVTVTGTSTYSGNFTASYDGDGNLISQTDPNNVTTNWTINEDGQNVGNSTSQSGSPWLSPEVAVPSIHGQLLQDTTATTARMYTYDADGRLTQAEDTPVGGGCTTRSYGYDSDSDRTSDFNYASNIDGSCQSTTASSTVRHSYDHADRLTDTGVSYDAYGRITTLPTADASESGSMTLGYYVNNLAYSESQASTTQCFGLDADQRLANSTTYSATSCSGTITASTTNHYDDDSDSPAWIAENPTASQWTSNVTDLGGSLALTVNQAGSPTYQYSDLHGDIEATASGGIGTLALAVDYDEFGNDTVGIAPRYGFLGTHQRSGQDLGGLIVMGVRLYDPVLGRWLQSDPVSGGSANAYDYCNQDPVNSADLAGDSPNSATYFNFIHNSGFVRHSVGKYGSFTLQCSYNTGSCAWGIRFNPTFQISVSSVNVSMQLTVFGRGTNVSYDKSASPLYHFHGSFYKFRYSGGHNPFSETHYIFGYYAISFTLHFSITWITPSECGVFFLTQTIYYTDDENGD